MRVPSKRSRVARGAREALAFGTEHLSLYQLTIEPATPFATLHRAGALTIPDDDQAAALYETTQELTEAAGIPAMRFPITRVRAPRRGIICCIGVTAPMLASDRARMAVLIFPQSVLPPPASVCRSAGAKKSPGPAMRWR